MLISHNDYNHWSQATFDWLRSYRQAFQEVVRQYQEMGYDWMTPESVAAPMAKEYHGGSDDPAKNQWRDGFALHNLLGGKPHDNSYFVDEYARVKALELMDNLQGKTGTGIKAVNTILKDLGPTKRQGANSIRTLTDYLENNPDDPLGLSSTSDTTTFYCNAPPAHRNFCITTLMIRITGRWRTR